MVNIFYRILFKYFLILSIFSTLIILNFISPRTVHAQTLVFEDNFNDNSINQSLWEIKNFNHARYGSSSLYGQLNIDEINQEIQIIGEDNIPDIYDPTYNKYYGWFGKTLITENTFTTNDQYFLEADFKITDADIGYAVYLTIEFNQKNRIVLSAGNYKYNNQLYWPAGTQLLLEENENIRWVGESLDHEYQSGVFTNELNIQNNKLYKIRLNINPYTRKIFAYLDEKLVHAGTYQGSLDNFRVGIAASVRYDGNYIDARFDDFKLYTEPSEIILNVPDVKQFTPQWANLEYDSAKKWYPSNPTISRWGCALTSASMILKYFGHDINPDALNEWLSVQKDGYTRNGSLMWPAISRLTQLRYSKEYNWPILEFTYLNYSRESLINSIKNDSPGIIKLLKPIYDKNNKITSYSSHFIIGKGFNETNIYINDPGKSGYTKLSQANSYWGSSSNIVNFKKSETDLSYIVLLIDEGFDIKVSNNQGEILGSDYYFKETPMTDPENPEAESNIETLNAFYYPKPETGTYNIKVSGEGVYRLDYYIYDQEGKVKLGNSFGIIEKDSTDEFNLIYDKNSLDISQLPAVSFESVLSYWDELYKNGYIENHGLYTSVKKLLENAYKNQQKNGNSSKQLLENILKKLDRFNVKNEIIFISDLNYQIEKLLSVL